MSDFRTETDLLGSAQIPKTAYWGIHTFRALHNFSETQNRITPELLTALAQVKQAAAQTNGHLGFLTSEQTDALSAACQAIIDGKFHNQFPLNPLQGGAGTSTNMNLNEVITNIALEQLGSEKGDYHQLHPNDHANLHQSTNDVYPTAVKMAAITLFRELADRLAELQETFQDLEKEFAPIVKIGRTEMQEAVPLTLGAEFGAFAEAFARDRWRCFKCEERLRLVNLGGTAVGTGLAAPRTYIFQIIEKLREISGMGLTRGENCIDQTANADAFVEVSATMKAVAVNLIKISRDLRQLHALGEITLPAVQAGSSIMPGKVNPVILEHLIQNAMTICSKDHLIEQAAAMGTLQINEFMPLIADSLLSALRLASDSVTKLNAHAKAITANADHCREHFEQSPTLITAFLPHLGYAQATELIQAFNNQSTLNLHDFLIAELGEGLFNRVLSAQALTALGYRPIPKALKERQK